MVVERQLAAQDTSRLELGRSVFLEKVWEWKAPVRRHDPAADAAHGQLGRLAARAVHDGRGPVASGHRSVSSGCTTRGLIYRGKRLVNWDPVLHTALSDLEVLSAEEAGHLWHFRYPFTDGTGHVTGGDDPPRDDARRHRRRCESGRRPLPRAGRSHRDIAIVRPRDPGRRGRLRRPGVRHRLRQDHAGARLQRLRRSAAVTTCR